MKCVKCGKPAVIDIRRHNAGFCAPHFIEHVHRQVERAVSSCHMFCEETRLLVAVSGGKDSLALWDILNALGYNADGFHLHLGINEYSDRSREAAEAFASSENLTLHCINVREETGWGIEELAKRVRYEPCAVCGIVKRYFMNRIAFDKGYDVILTGHNLDDEAATLLGNILHWQTEYLGRQSPLLPPKSGFVGRAKPLFRLTERETAAYTVLRGIDYILEDCPMSSGATSLNYKEVLNRLEDVSPGTKHHFLLGFFKRGQSLFQGDDAELAPCRICGQPTTSEVCAFCSLLQRAKKDPSD
jgi:uncharacterized protein (TIGR00269 family)